MLNMDKEYTEILGKKQPRWAVVIILFCACTTLVATGGLI